jgi:hypothetical protein
MTNTAKFSSATDALTFMTSGNATVTLVSVKSGTRFTYKLKAGANPDDELFFVSLLGGPDNEADYRYLGRIAKGVFYAGRRNRKPGDVTSDAPSSRAFVWAWQVIRDGTIPAALEIWHEGRCGRCNRKLTVPSSIASGMGPECAGKGGFSADWA